MKSATIFLVAVTVFTGLLQQSSAAPKSLLGGVGGILGKVGIFVDDTLDNVFEIVGDVTENVGGLVGKVLGTIGLLIEGLLKGIVKELKPIKVILADIIPKLETLKKEDKEKVKEAIAKLAADLKKLESVVVELGKGLGKVTVETVEEIKAELAQLKKQIDADLKNLLTVAEAILEKGEEGVADLVSLIKSIVAKVTKEVDSILLKVGKVLKALLAKLTGALENTSDEFKKNIAKNMEDSNTARGEALKLVRHVLATATGIEKEALEKLAQFLVDLDVKVQKLHSDLAEGAISGDKTLLKKIVGLINETIANVNEVLPGLLEHVENTIQVAVTDFFEIFIKAGKNAVKDIEKEIGH